VLLRERFFDCSLPAGDAHDFLRDRGCAGGAAAVLAIQIRSWRIRRCRFAVGQRCSHAWTFCLRVPKRVNGAVGTSEVDDGRRDDYRCGRDMWNARQEICSAGSGARPNSRSRSSSVCLRKWQRHRNDCEIVSCGVAVESVSKRQGSDGAAGRQRAGDGTRAARVSCGLERGGIAGDCASRSA